MFYVKIDAGEEDNFIDCKPILSADSLKPPEEVMQYVMYVIGVSIIICYYIKIWDGGHFVYLCLFVCHIQSFPQKYSKSE